MKSFNVHPRVDDVWRWQATFTHQPLPVSALVDGFCIKWNRNYMVLESISSLSRRCRTMMYHVVPPLPMLQCTLTAGHLWFRTGNDVSMKARAPGYWPLAHHHVPHRNDDDRYLHDCMYVMLCHVMSCYVMSCLVMQCDVKCNLIKGNIMFCTLIVYSWICVRMYIHIYIYIYIYIYTYTYI